MVGVGQVTRGEVALVRRGERGRGLNVTDCSLH